MSNSVAIVTGGAQGIGAAICKVLLKEGYKVCVADIQNEKGKQYAEELNKTHGSGNALFVYCDVRSETDFKRTFEETQKQFGKVDLLVNNAGILSKIDPKDTVNVNLMGPIYGCRTALHFMGKSNGGRGGAVINIASVLGLVPFHAIPVYVATKHGIIGLTRSYGHPYHMKKDGVFFAALCPYITETGMVDTKLIETLDPTEREKIQQPDEVALGVLKLLKDNINGSVLISTKPTGFKYVDVDDELKEIIKI